MWQRPRELTHDELDVLSETSTRKDMIKHERLWRNAGWFFHGSTVGQNMLHGRLGPPGGYRRRDDRARRTVVAIQHDRRRHHRGH